MIGIASVAATRDDHGLNPVLRVNPTVSSTEPGERAGA